MKSYSSSSALPAKFLTGSVMNHILVMTSTSAIGLLGIFLVDLLDILFLSMLGSDDIIAAVGFSASLSYFTISMSIGISISMAALVSRAIGQGNGEQARRYVINVAVLAFLLTSLMALLIGLNIAPLLALLGASPEVATVGVSYLSILLPSLPFLATGMALSAALRAVGDAKLAMYATLIGGAVNAVLDPIFIFVLDMGIEGAAIASVLSRFAVLGLAIYGVKYKHQIISRFVYRHFVSDLRAIFKIAGPAISTNVVTPIGNAIVINAMAAFGGAYVAGFAIIGRVSPVAFALVFSLSGAVAPIIGQNFGAHNIDRIKQTLKSALFFNVTYVMAVSLLLFLLQEPIISLFTLEGEAAMLMRVFCSWIAITFIFNGAQFIANSSFNNLAKPIYATWFNVGKCTIGTLPFVMIGGQMAGPTGVLIGQAVGGMLFAIAAVVVAFKVIGKLEQSGAAPSLVVKA